MRRKYGIIFLDTSEIVIRIYEVSQNYWQLLRYESKHFTAIKRDMFLTTAEIVETIADFSLSPYSQHVLEWKVCARRIPEKVLQDVALATGFHIETLSPLREQELLCKGMFTELW